MENFGKFMTIVLFIIFTPIINGFVFSKLWLWFIVPIFQVQPLRVVEAIGIIFLINFICARRRKYTHRSFWKGLTDDVVFTVVIAGLILLFGWIVTLFL